MPLLSTQNLKKSYDNNTILKGIDFELKKGEFVSLLGASGSGKSTFLHMLASMDEPDEGNITLNGKKYSDLTKKDFAKLRNQEVGFVFQFHHLLPDFTVMENIILPALIAKKGHDEAKAYAQELISFMGISDLEDRRPQQISGGEQQRAAIARALINKPVLVLADEPSGNLDSDNTQIVQELFSKINKELDQAIIMATHNEELAQSADRIIRIENGRLVE